jgi:hypothetical protein
VQGLFLLLAAITDLFFAVFYLSFLKDSDISFIIPILLSQITTFFILGNE